MIAGAKPSVNEDAIMYQARTVLADLSNEIAAARKLTSPETKVKIKKAKIIYLWLQALDYRAYLSREQREKIWYALIHIAGLNDFPTAPLLELRETPNILIGSGGGTTTVTNNYDAGTPFLNSDVAAPSEVVDTFATSLSNGCRWEYTVMNSAGTILKKGSISAGWVGSTIDWGGEVVSAEIGDASAVVFSASISAGNVQLIATVSSDNWIVSGKRYLD